LVSSGRGVVRNNIVVDDDKAVNGNILR